ncbi:unnamed protein product, partial [Heterosigma akashiwo]
EGLGGLDVADRDELNRRCWIILGKTYQKLKKDIENKAFGQYNSDGSFQSAPVSDSNENSKRVIRDAAAELQAKDKVLRQKENQIKQLQLQLTSSKKLG